MQLQSTALQQPTQVRGSYLTFKAGDMHFAMSALHVRYITAQYDFQRKVHRPDGKDVKVFQFDNQNVSCFEFEDIIGAVPQAQCCAELSETLKQRKQDHIDWLEALETSIKTGAPFTKATDPHQCAFGKWYDSFKSDDRDLNHILKALGQPHERLHSIAVDLLVMDDKKAAMLILQQERNHTLHRLLDLFDDVLKRLEEMQRRIAIIVDNNGHLFAIELYHIHDLITFDENHLDNSRDICNELPMDTDIIHSIYQQDESPLYLVIDIDKLTAKLN